MRRAAAQATCSQFELQFELQVELQRDGIRDVAKASPVNREDGSLWSAYMRCQATRQGSNPNSTIPVGVPTNTFPFTITGVMNLFPVNASRAFAAWLLL
jgi:hypothetical protein